MACGLASTVPFAAPAASGAEVAQSSRVTFQYHSNFLLNLHHFLLDIAANERDLAREVCPQEKNGIEIEILRAAASTYRARFAHKSLLFDPELFKIKETLSGDDARRSIGGLDLPPEVADALGTTAPIYERCLWSAQDRSNRDWIAAVQALDATYGAEIQAGIEHDLAHEFTKDPVRVDVVVVTGDRNGAYTSDRPPHAVLPSGRADYQGLAALEMLYHESSHVGVTDAVEAAIDAEITATHRPPDHSLWHAVQFYTVGAVVRNVLKEHGNLDYEPYAEKNGVYRGAWSDDKALIVKYWLPYLRGESDMATAAKAMVDELPPG
jgi:hypothetical protein